MGTTRQAGRAGHTEEMALKAVSHSFSEEEEDRDAEVVEEAQDEAQDAARQQRRERMPAREKQAPLQQDPGIKRARAAASESIEQETLIATTVVKQITGRTNARI